MIVEEAGKSREERRKYNLSLMQAWDVKGPAPTLVCEDCGDDDAQEDEVYGNVVCQDCWDENYSSRAYPREFY